MSVVNIGGPAPNFIIGGACSPHAPPPPPASYASAIENLVSIFNMNCSEFASVLYCTFSKVIPSRSNDDKMFLKSL